jgi:hypothetical protein
MAGHPPNNSGVPLKLERIEVVWYRSPDRKTFLWALLVYGHFILTL